MALNIALLLWFLCTKHIHHCTWPQIKLARYKILPRNWQSKASNRSRTCEGEHTYIILRNKSPYMHIHNVTHAVGVSACVLILTVLYNHKDSQWHVQTTHAKYMHRHAAQQSFSFLIHKITRLHYSNRKLLCYTIPEIYHLGSIYEMAINDELWEVGSSN